MHTTAIGDPSRMRPSVTRKDFGYADPIGVYLTDSGRRVNVTWLTCSQTHCHIVVWDEGDPSLVLTVQNICRVNAAVETEKLLEQL